MKKAGTYQKRHTTKDKEGTTVRWVGGVDSQYTQVHTHVGDPEIEESL